MPDPVTPPTNAPATGDPTPPAPATPPFTDPPTAPVPPELGDAGKAALEAERKARRDAEARARKADEELERIRTANLSESEKAIAEARKAGADEARAGTLRRLVEAEVRAAAAGRLADPGDAVRLIDVDQFIPKGDEDIDTQAIIGKLNELTAAKPYLVGTTAPPPPPAPPATGNVPGGPQGSGKPGTFARSQLRDPAFYQANRDAILKAAAEGRITND